MEKMQCPQCPEHPEMKKLATVFTLERLLYKWMCPVCSHIIDQERDK